MNDKVMNSQASIRILCLGISAHWVTLWLERPDVEIVGFVDLYDELEIVGSPESVLVAESEIPLFATVTEALAHLRPDIVTLVTPPRAKTRMDVIESVLLAGHDIYLEKFRPADRLDAKRLLDWSQQTGRRIAIGEAYRFDSLVERAKQVISKGILGQVEQIVWSCYRPNVNADWMKAYDHLMLEDLSYHHFDVIHYLVGVQQFKRVYATSVCPSWSKVDKPLITSVIAQGDEGCQLTYHASWAAQGRHSSWLGDFRIEGSQGMLLLHGTQLILTDAKGEEQLLEPDDPYPYEMRAGVIQEYVSAWLEKRQTSLDIEFMYPVLQMIHAAVKSAETAMPVELSGN